MELTKEQVIKLGELLDNAEYCISTNDYTKAKEWYSKFFVMSGHDLTRHPFGLNGKMLIEARGGSQWAISLIEKLAKATFLYAMLCRKTGELNEAIKVYNISFAVHGVLEEITGKLDFRVQRLQIQNNIAFIYDEMGNFDLANDYFLNTLSGFLAFEKLGAFGDQVVELRKFLEEYYKKHKKFNKFDILAQFTKSNDFDEKQKLIEQLKAREEFNDLTKILGGGIVDAITKKKDTASADDLFAVGILHMHGQGVPQDLKKAFEFFMAAAEKGHADAMDSVGVFYKEGVAGEKDLTKAIEWIEKAVKAGSAGGMFNLAVCYFKGEGIKQCNLTGIEYMKQAAQKGFEKAQHFLKQHDIKWE